MKKIADRLRADLPRAYLIQELLLTMNDKDFKELRSYAVEIINAMSDKNRDPHTDIPRAWFEASLTLLVSNDGLDKLIGLAKQEIKIQPGLKKCPIRE